MNEANVASDRSVSVVDRYRRRHIQLKGCRARRGDDRLTVAERERIVGARLQRQWTLQGRRLSQPHLHCTGQRSGRQAARVPTHRAARSADATSVARRFPTVASARTPRPPTTTAARTARAIAVNGTIRAGWRRTRSLRAATCHQSGAQTAPPAHAARTHTAARLNRADAGALVPCGTQIGTQWQALHRRRPPFGGPRGLGRPVSRTFASPVPCRPG